MLLDFGCRSISLSVRPRPVHQLAPEPQPEARSARRCSQYLLSKANAIFLLCPVLSCPSTASTAARQQCPAGPRHWQPALPALNCPCACLARSGPVSLHRSAAAFAPPESIMACGQVFRRLPAPSLPARPTSRLKRPDPRQSKQDLLACPILSLPARACAGTPLMIPALHYPGPLPSSAWSSRSSTVRSGSRAPAPQRPRRRSISPQIVYSRDWAVPATTWRSQARPPYRLDPMRPANSAPGQLHVSPNLNLSLPRRRPKPPSP
jgi:hypothetical protein